MDVLNGFLVLVSVLLRWSWKAFVFILTRPRWLWRKIALHRRRRKAQGTARWAYRWEQWWYRAIRGEGVLLGRGAFGRLLASRHESGESVRLLRTYPEFRLV